jgi:hypothetical protein
MLYATTAAFLVCTIAFVSAAPVQVFILMGQSNMLGMGRVIGNNTNGTLEFAVHNESKCSYLPRVWVGVRAMPRPPLTPFSHTHAHTQ